MRAGGKRKRGEPHEPQPPAHEDPTVGAPIHADGQELGQRGEERVAEADREAAAAAGPLAQVGGASSLGETVRLNPGNGPGADPTKNNVSDESFVIKATTLNDQAIGRTSTLAVLFACSEQTGQGQYVCLCANCTYAGGTLQPA